LGVGEGVFAFFELSELSLVTLGLIVGFGFGLVDCFGAGVGLSGTSWIGAGSR